jgi:hypothetical protein
MRELADEIENDKNLSEKYELEQSEKVVNSNEEIKHENIVETEEDSEVETSCTEDSEAESSVLEDSCSDCDNEINKLANDIIDKVVESNL